MESLLPWLVLGLPLPWIGFFGYRSVKTRRITRRALWAGAVLLVSAAYTAFLLALCVIVAAGYMLGYFLGAQAMVHQAGALLQVLGLGLEVFVRVTLLAGLVFLATTGVALWQKLWARLNRHA